MPYQMPIPTQSPTQSPSGEVVTSNPTTTNPLPFEIVIPPIVWPEIPNPVKDAAKILSDSKPVIQKWVWVIIGGLLIGLSLIVMGYSGISGEVRETVYNPAKNRIKKTVGGTK